MEEYRGKYRKTSHRAAYTYDKNKNGYVKGFLSKLIKQTIWSALILAAVMMISYSQFSVAETVTGYIKSAISYKPNIDWAIESINTFFGKNEEVTDVDGNESIPVSAEINNTGTPEQNIIY